MSDAAAAQEQQQRDGDRPERVHEGRTDGGRCYGAQVGAKQSLRGGAESRYFPRLHAEGLDDAVAGDGLVQNVLDIGQLVLAATRSRPNTAADANCRENDEGNKQQEHPSKLPPQKYHQDCGKDEGEELLQELGQDTRHGELHALNVVDDGRDQRPGCVLLEERNRPAQDRVIQVIAQIGNHAETRMVHQVSSGIVENPLEYGGGNQGIRDDGPCVVKMRGNKTLQVNGLVDLWNREEQDTFRTRRRNQHAIQYRLQQDKPKRLEEPDGCEQHHSGYQLHEEREHVTDEARHLPHGTPARYRPQLLAAGGMGLRCKALFYLSRALEEG